MAENGCRDAISDPSIYRHLSSTKSWFVGHFLAQLGSPCGVGVSLETRAQRYSRRNKYGMKRVSNSNHEAKRLTM